jgi:hypothetical protein
MNDDCGEVDLTTGLEPASVRIRNAVLVQLSYVRVWCAVRDSNPHPPARGAAILSVRRTARDWLRPVDVQGEQIRLLRWSDWMRIERDLAHACGGEACRVRKGACKTDRVAVLSPRLRAPY